MCLAVVTTAVCREGYCRNNGQCHAVLGKKKAVCRCHEQFMGKRCHKLRSEKKTYKRKEKKWKTKNKLRLTKQKENKVNIKTGKIRKRKRRYHMSKIYNF